MVQTDSFPRELIIPVRGRPSGNTVRRETVVLGTTVKEVFFTFGPATGAFQPSSAWHCQLNKNLSPSLYLIRCLDIHASERPSGT